MEDYQEVPLPVQNRGFNRLGVGSAYDGPTLADLERKPEPVLAWTARDQRPMARLQWWESELYAAKGIEEMARRPFLVVPPEWRTDWSRKLRAVRTTTLYPTALRPQQRRRIEETAQYVAAMVRQAREFYTAAESVGVSDLSRPVLYYYGALALAKAATAALFGRNLSEERSHGLTFGKGYGRSVRHTMPGWPTIIEWQASGVFVRLYRAARWDTDLYLGSASESQWKAWKKRDEASLPRFHILECLRWLGCDWGLLPPTGFEWEWPYVRARTAREKCLLHYGGADDMFLRYDTPLARPLFEVPTIVVQYMVLYYFSILARYYGLEWQRLLTATREPEGFVFRKALEEVAYRYALEVHHLLLRIGDADLLSFPSPTPPYLRRRPNLVTWYRNPVARVPRTTASSPVIAPSA